MFLCLCLCCALGAATCVAWCRRSCLDCVCARSTPSLCCPGPRPSSRSWFATMCFDRWSRSRWACCRGWSVWTRRATDCARREHCPLCRSSAFSISLTTSLCALLLLPLCSVCLLCCVSSTSCSPECPLPHCRCHCWEARPSKSSLSQDATWFRALFFFQFVFFLKKKKSILQDRLPALAGLSSLSDLDVSENALSDVDAPLSGVMSLRILVASGNPLRTVPKCASVLRKLDLRRTLVTEQQKEEAQREGLELLWEKTVEKQDEEKVTKRRKKKQKKKKLAPDGEAKEGEEEEKKQEEQLKEPTPKKQKKKKTKEKKKTKKNKKQKVALVADEAAVAQLLAPKPVDSW